MATKKIYLIYINCRNQKGNKGQLTRRRDFKTFVFKIDEEKSHLGLEAINFIKDLHYERFLNQNELVYEFEDVIPNKERLSNILSAYFIESHMVDGLFKCSFNPEFVLQIFNDYQCSREQFLYSYNIDNSVSHGLNLAVSKTAQSNFPLTLIGEVNLKQLGCSNTKQEIEDKRSDNLIKKKAA